MTNVATNAANATISIIAVNDPPTVDAHGGSLAYTENDTPKAIAPYITNWLTRITNSQMIKPDGDDRVTPRSYAVDESVAGHKT